MYQYRPIPLDLKFLYSNLFHEGSTNPLVCSSILSLSLVNILAHSPFYISPQMWNGKFVTGVGVRVFVGVGM
jgi:hypothetical protein